MARDLNKVMLIGHLGKDPESRFFPDGSQLTTLSVATSNTYKDKQGQRQQKTQWHSVKVYGKMAEFAQKFLTKGSKIYVEGELVYREWQDKQSSQKRRATDIIVDQFNGSLQFLDTLPQNQNTSAHQQYPRQQRPPQQNNQYANARNGGHQQQPQPAQVQYDQYDESIPF
ncbi:MULTISPECIES: single-stranded DNA-binding protein [unclassified Endozoicomonas]|uniref:single-stranded DNA-binding protein n=1 Tax=unclassified Endozoicomonas TaxID=2644528 RepID=UPI003BB7BDB1